MLCSSCVVAYQYYGIFTGFVVGTRLTSRSVPHAIQCLWFHSVIWWGVAYTEDEVKQLLLRLKWKMDLMMKVRCSCVRVNLVTDYLSHILMNRQLGLLMVGAYHRLSKPYYQDPRRAPLQSSLRGGADCHTWFNLICAQFGFDSNCRY